MPTPTTSPHSTMTIRPRTITAFAILLFSLCLNTSTADTDPSTVGTVFSRQISKPHFELTREFIRVFITGKASNEQTWQRLALLEYANQQNLKATDSAIQAEQHRILRHSFVQQQLSKRYPNPVTAPEARQKWTQDRAELEKNWKYNADQEAEFLNSIKLKKPLFTLFARQQATLELLEQHNKQAILKADPELGRETTAIAAVTVDWCGLSVNDLTNVKLIKPTERLARLFFEAERLRYRRKRLIKLALIRHKDNGSLAELAKIKANYTSQHKPGQTITDFAVKPMEIATSKLTEVDQYTAPLLKQFLSYSPTEDMLNRSPRLSVSQPLRFGGYQWLYQILETQAPKTLSYKEAGGLNPNGKLMQDWRRFAGLGAVLARAHEIKANAEKLNWQNWIPKQIKQQNTGQQLTNQPGSPFPEFLKQRVFTQRNQSTFVGADLHKRIVYLIHVQKRTITLKKLRPLSNKQRQKRLNKILATRRNEIYAAAKGITKANLEAMQQSFFPTQQAYVRTIVIPKPNNAKEQPKIDIELLHKCFQNGESLELIAARLNVHQKPRIDNVQIPTSAMLSAMTLSHYEISPIFEDQGHLCLQTTAPATTTNLNLVFEIRFKAHTNKDAIAQRLESIRDHLNTLKGPARLAKFQFLAKKYSQTATATSGGYTGTLPTDTDPVRRSLKSALAIYSPGQRCQLDLGTHLAFLTILDTAPLDKTQAQYHRQRAQQALPWTHKLNR